jgi:hypothetical protein
MAVLLMYLSLLLLGLFVYFVVEGAVDAIVVGCFMLLLMLLVLVLLLLP